MPMTHAQAVRAGKKAAATRRRNAKKGKRWIQRSKRKIKKGALHKALGISQNKKIGRGLLKKIVSGQVGSKVRGRTVTPKMKKQARWALNV